MKAIFTLISFVAALALKAQPNKGPAAAPAEYLQSLDSAAASKYFPRWLGNIDAKDFPPHAQLQTFLLRNKDFNFHLSMDTYLDLLRFKAIDTAYEDEKVKKFLYLHDLLYLKYENNDALLAQKIKACKDMLHTACSKYNLQDIYYKDYKIDLNSLTANGRPTALMPFDDKDDYYQTKRIKGEDNLYYTRNALSVYLTNWVALNDLNANYTPLDSILAKVDGADLTMRIYFLIQPSCAKDAEGTSKGVTAYGLKAVLFTDCPSKPLATIHNQDVYKIPDVVVRRCYFNALSYLNDSIKYVGYDEVINTAPLYHQGYSDLGQWYDPVGDCEVAYNYISGKIEKAMGKQVILSLRMMTNYNCTLQPGYEILFSNRLTDAKFSFPITEANTVQSQSAAGYYDLAINMPDTIVKQMIDAHVNSISFQCSGTPKYHAAHNYVLPYPNKVITRRVSNITSNFDINSGEIAERLETFLGKAVQ